MIDLEWDHLPDSILVDGREVAVHTSFRVWLRFGRLLEERGVASAAVLKEPCGGDWLPAALEFYRSENVTPRGSDGAQRLIDLTLDGDYIVGSFQQAYGIDLTEGDMHWHRFLALLRSLPEDTKLMRIAGWRGWRKSRRSQESIMRQLRGEWALPPRDGDAGLGLRREAGDFLDANEAQLRRRLEGRG